MSENYYVVLGVDADATLEQIKTAYRGLVKQLHPDHFGGGSAPFRAVQEAYEVLSDPDRRRAYDEELARAQRLQRFAPGTTSRPLRRRRPPAEPLVPTGRGTSPWDAFFDMPFISPLEELQRRPWGTGRTKDIHVQLSLTPEEARHGGRVRLWIPLAQSCPACRGRGGDWFFECLRCLGRGVVVRETPVVIAFPGHIVDGSTGSVSLHRPGMQDVVLTLHFRISRP